jgi:serine/threonine protein kinase
VTPAVEAIIQRCLSADPSHRYQTAAELQEDLERHLKQLPLRHAHEPSVRANELINGCDGIRG